MTMSVPQFLIHHDLVDPAATVTGYGDRSVPDKAHLLDRCGGAGDARPLSIATLAGLAPEHACPCINDAALYADELPAPDLAATVQRTLALQSAVEQLRGPSPAVAVGHVRSLCRWLGRRDGLLGEAVAEATATARNALDATVSTRRWRRDAAFEILKVLLEPSANRPRRLTLDERKHLAEVMAVVTGTVEAGSTLLAAASSIGTGSAKLGRTDKQTLDALWQRLAADQVWLRVPRILISTSAYPFVRAATEVDLDPRRGLIRVPRALWLTHNRATGTSWLTSRPATMAEVSTALDLVEVPVAVPAEQGPLLDDVLDALAAARS